MPKASELTTATALTDDDYLIVVDDPAGTPATKKITAANAATYFGSAEQPPLEYALSDETTSITTGTKLVVRAPYELTLEDVRASLTTQSSSGAVTVDVEADGTTIFTTPLTVDASERTSVTATPAVLDTTYVADDTELAFIVDGAGTGAKGLKVKLYHQRGGTPPAAGDVEVVAASNTSYATRSTTTVTKPSGTADGDVILLGILTGASSEAPDPTPPAGFTLLTGLPVDATDGSFNVETRVYVRVASSEPASWDFTHTSCSSQGFAVAFRNVDTGTPIDVNPNAATGTGATSTVAALTTVTDGAMVVWISHDWGSLTANLTPPTSTGVTFTEIVEVNPLLYVAAGLMATAGSIGSTSMGNNNTPATSDTWGALTVALRPA